MRKSAVMMMVILVLVFVGVMFASSSLMARFQRDAEVSRDLTRYLDTRGDLAEGSRVKAFRVKGGKNRLAAEGSGLRLEITPSTSALKRPGALHSYLRGVARAAALEAGVGPLDWVEVVLASPTSPGDPPLRTLVTVIGSQVGDLVPPPPHDWPARPASPAPVASPSAPIAAPVAAPIGR